MDSCFHVLYIFSFHQKQQKNLTRISIKNLLQSGINRNTLINSVPLRRSQETCVSKIKCQVKHISQIGTPPFSIIISMEPTLLYVDHYKNQHLKDYSGYIKLVLCSFASSLFLSCRNFKKLGLFALLLQLVLGEDAHKYKKHMNKCIHVIFSKASIFTDMIVFLLHHSWGESRDKCSTLI